MLNLKKAILIIRLFSPVKCINVCLTILLNLSFAQSACFAAQVTLPWNPNTEKNLAGYRIYYKIHTPGAPYDGAGANEGDSPIDVPLAKLTDEDNPEYSLTGLRDTETYHFVVTAYDDYAKESDYSNAVSVSFAVNKDDGDGGGCFIVMAAFGSEMVDHVHATYRFTQCLIIFPPIKPIFTMPNFFTDYGS